MIRRWSLLARLGAIVAIGLFALQLLVVGVVFAQRSNDTEAGFRFPLPDQTAAMVEMFETGTDRPRLLRALNSSDLSVSIESGRIEEFETERLRIPDIERVIGRYTSEMGGRRVAAFIAIPDDGEMEYRVGDLGLLTRWPLRLVVELSSGELLKIESRGGDLTHKVFSWPLGMLSGVISVLVACMVLWAVRRETRPLRDLARATRGFAKDGVRREVEVSGAPDLRDLASAFDQMQGQIGDLLDSRTLMLGAMGHDLRTYITRLRLRLHTVEPEEVRVAAERDLEQVTALVDDSIALARLRIDGPGADTTDLSGLLEVIADEHAEQGHDLHLALPPVPARSQVHARSATLRRLFGNLVENALTYGSQCWISLTLDPTEIRVDIVDDGPGVPAEELPWILRPFYRSDAARTLDRSGSGLGLAIAHEIASACGGSLRLRSDMGEGLRCTVRLPLAS
ncbi:MAG: ATP-binding protein [Pseudomonadota bacterium]